MGAWAEGAIPGQRFRANDAPDCKVSPSSIREVQPPCFPSQRAVTMGRCTGDRLQMALLPYDEILLPVSFGASGGPSFSDLNSQGTHLLSAALPIAFPAPVPLSLPPSTPLTHTW